MRYLILSDIHANWEALQAVLQRAADSYDEIVNCGDLVGYGPDPNAVVDWCRDHNVGIVRGNHDRACALLESLEWFNPVARLSAIWTHQVLTSSNRTFLTELPKGPFLIADFQILHGAPHDEDEYIVSEWQANDAAPHLDLAVSFFGHTHLQGGFAIHRNGIRSTPPDYFDIEVDMKYLINPGSVGQPRDGDPRAAYAIYDTDLRSVVYGRVDYDVAGTHRKIADAGLPEVLGHRLYIGA